MLSCDIICEVKKKRKNAEITDDYKVFYND
jgi:hypothetical protein